MTRKIYFNDTYGMTQAVLDKRKTKMIEFFKVPSTYHGITTSGISVSKNAYGDFFVSIVDEDEAPIDGGYIYPKYKLGEEISVAQSYTSIGEKCYYYRDTDEFMFIMRDGTDHAIDPRGVDNKMFVRPDLMPHQIKITKVDVLHVQDLTEDDCIQEGIMMDAEKGKYFLKGKRTILGNTAKDVFSKYVNRIKGKETWEDNPFVLMYDFILIK